MIAFLTKSDASERFDQIVDFLNAHSIQYALLVNPTIYASCIKQFWAFISIKKSNDAVKLQALIDRKKRTAWNEFSSSMASAVIFLATEPAKVEEVLEVVTASKLMTEVVTTAVPITIVAQVPKASALRKRRGVVIQDPEVTATA
nr:hypothetical protein [Tanacetum cinerariifolium]